MDKKMLYLFILTTLIGLTGCITQVPTTSKIQLMDDIREKDVSFGIGSEMANAALSELEGFLPDPLFWHIKYSPVDYLEIGASFHYFYIPFLEVKTDVIDIFTDNSPLSVLLGVELLPNFFLDQEDNPVLISTSLAVNYRVREKLSLYTGAGIDNVSLLGFTPTIHAGLFVYPEDWITIAAEIKGVINRGIEDVEQTYGVFPVIYLRFGF